ncbi:MAG: hypothetical protein OXG44_17660 [Gammaproteobacteria bacterium]|nr:hypothetical protein [Gammaproteobacteria bacterium]
MNASDIDQVLGVKAQSVSLGDLLARANGRRRATWQDLPTSPGIYAVCLRGWNTLSFDADAGHAKYAEPADPNLLCDKRHRILAAGPTDILYVGKAGAKTSNLRERIRTLARFGMGRARNHKGGEWLWQVQGINDANVRMWCCPRGRPELLECELLERFRNDHGDWPLANRRR